MQNIGEQIRCIMGDVQVVYSAFLTLIYSHRQKSSCEGYTT